MSDSTLKQLLHPKFLKEMTTNPRWLTQSALTFALMLLFWIPAIWLPTLYLAEGRDIITSEVVKQFLFWAFLYLLAAPIPATILHLWHETVASPACLINALAWFAFLIMLWVIIGGHALTPLDPLFLALCLIPAAILCNSKPVSELAWLKEMVLTPQWLALTLAIFIPVTILCEFLNMDAITRWGLLFLILSMGAATALSFKFHASLGLALDLPAFSISDKPSQFVLGIFAILLVPGIVVSIYLGSSINERANRHEHEFINKTNREIAHREPAAPPATTQSK